MSSYVEVPMTGRERFAARVDNSRLADLSTGELRTRLDLLRAEIEQLDHDQEHIETDTYGFEKFSHLRAIAKERLAAANKVTKFALELSKRTA